ncbi:caspase family protein [Streptomyces sp. NPDC049555]|uniref:caspase family protein n=1 Tax=unclassified Streptomyces TaxID=2593676 RepID=UPI00342052E5
MTRGAQQGIRHTLFIGGTATYDHQPELRGVRSDIEVVSGLFGALGYETEPPLLDRTSAEFRTGLSAWAAAEDRTDDALVLYYSGHGELSHERHYLMCRDSCSNQLTGTAVATEDVVRIVSEGGVRRLLLIIDTCYAAQGGIDAARSLACDLGIRLSTTRAADGHRLTAFSVIAAARSQELAEDGAFTHALRAAIDDPGLGGHRQPKLYLEQVVDRVNEILATHSPYQHAAWGTLPSGEGFSFIPNPRYAPDMPDEDMDVAEQRTWASAEGRRRREELLTHFGPRGRGTDVFADATGSYFTGRAAALAVLTAWLDARSSRLGRCVVVTGRGGVGKSSLLGRLVLLADPGLRAALPDVAQDFVPPRRQVHAAVHARHKLLEDVTAGIADAAGLSETDPERLATALAARAEPLVVVIDALDEAGTAGTDEEPHRIAALLLAPLSRLSCVQLLVGTRPHVLDSLGDQFIPLDLDEAQWTGERDIAAYARRLLLAPDGPGSVGVYTEATTEPVSDAVSVRADGNYLVARLIARSLAHRPAPLDTTCPGWEGQLPALSESPDRSAGPAFRWVLHEQLRTRADRGLALLTALAHAEGTGLPGEMWRAAASTFTTDPVTGQDIRWILESAGAHIIEGRDTGPDGEARSVYRLYHQSYADELRSTAGSDANARIAAALMATVPPAPVGQGRVWSTADSYVRAHLASHATGSSLFDELVIDPSYLLAAEPSTLLRALRHVKSSQATAARFSYESCAPVLRTESDLMVRAAQLRLAALQTGDEVLADAVRGCFPELPWDTLWADVPTSSDPFRAVGTFSNPLRGVEVLDVSGTRVMATAQEPNRTELWDLDTGAPLGPLPSTASPHVLALASCQEKPAAWLLAHSRDVPGWDSTIEVFDARTRHRLGKPLVTRAVHCALAEIEGTCVVGVVNTDGTVELVEARTGSVLVRLTSRLRTSKLEPESSQLVRARMSGRRHPQHLAMGVVDGHLVVTAAVGVSYHASSRSGRAELAVWWVDARDGWRVRNSSHYRLTGREVTALTVRRGRILVSTIGRLRITGRAQAIRRQGIVTEWFVRRGPGPVAFVSTDLGRYRVRASGSGIQVTDGEGRRTNSIDCEAPWSAHITATPVGTNRASLLIWREDSPSVQARELSLVGEAGNKGSGVSIAAHRAFGTVMGQVDGRAVLAECTYSGSHRLLDPTSGEAVAADGRFSFWATSYCGTRGLPIIGYRWLRQWRALHWVRVYEEFSPRRVRLHGGFLPPVSDMWVTKEGGRPLLVGQASGGHFIAWTLDGRVAGRARLTGCFDARTLAVGRRAILSVHDLRARAIRVYELPDFAPIASIPDRRYTSAYDLAMCGGTPVVVHADGMGLVRVRSFLDTSIEWRWRLPETHPITHLALTTVAGRGAAVVCTSAGSVLMAEADSGRLLSYVRLGTAIRSLTVVEEATVVLVTAKGGTLCLRLAPARGGP